MCQRGFCAFHQWDFKHFCYDKSRKFLAPKLDKQGQTSAQHNQIDWQPVPQFRYHIRYGNQAGDYLSEEPEMLLLDVIEC